MPVPFTQEKTKVKMNEMDEWESLHVEAVKEGCKNKIGMG